MNWKLIIGIIFLSFQVGRLVYVRFSDYNYFTWMPHDVQTEYLLNVYVNGAPLGDIDLKQRYGLTTHMWHDIYPNHIFKWMEEYEKYHPRSPTDSIIIHYEMNGHGWKTWKWIKKYHGLDQ